MYEGRPYNGPTRKTPAHQQTLATVRRVPCGNDIDINRYPVCTTIPRIDPTKSTITNVNQKETNNMTQVSTAAATTKAADAIRPFHVNFPEAALVDLRRRIAATKWPEREPVSDATQGVQLATMQKLASYWTNGYDWRKVEERLNSYPNFITNIDGVDIHFIQVKSKHPNAMPVIVTHGWPGSIIEQLKIIDPLTNPTAHGGRAEDAFDVVIPSMPGYGFSGKPATTGWGPEHIARAWDVLMKRLGYERYVAQ